MYRSVPPGNSQLQTVASLLLASLLLVSPGAVTDGVALFFPQKQTTVYLVLFVIYTYTYNSGIT